MNDQPDPLPTAAQQRTLIQNQAFQAAINGEPLVNTLNILAQLVKLELGSGVRTAFYLAYPDGKRLHAIEGAGDMDPAYTAPLNGFPVSDDSFCSGYAMATGRPVHTPDVFQHPQWQPYRPMATAHGFRSASSYPILTRPGKAIGSLALYFPHVHQATDQEAALAEAITRAAALLLAPDTQTLEHTRAQEALRQSEAKYRTLFESIDEGVALVEVFPDEHGRVTDMIWREANPSVERQAGMGGWVGRRASEMVPHLEQAWLDAMTGVYQTGEPVRMEAYMADLDRWIETYYSRVGEAGSPLMVSVFRNSTERKQREQHQEFLVRLSDHLRAESDPEVIGAIATRMVAEQLQADRCYIAHLPKGEGYGSIGSEYKATGLPPVRGAYRFDDFPDAMKRIETGPLIIRDVFNEAGLSETDKQAIGHAMGLQGLLAAVLRKGERNYFWCLTAATLTPRNWTDYHVEFLEDVAERIWIAIERAKAEEAVKKSEAKYRTLFNSIDEGFCTMELIYDRAGKPVDYSFQEVNPAFEAAIGLQNAVGKSITELVAGIEAQWFETYDKVIKTGQPVRFERYNEATQSWYSAYASRIGTAGTQLAVIFNNVTEHKQREHQQALLVTLGDTIRPLTDPVAIEGEVTQLLRAHFAAGWCYYMEWEEASKRGVVHRDAARKGLTSLVGDHDVSDVPEFLELLKANPLLAVPDYEHYELLTPALRQRYTSLGFRSMLVATLVKQDRLVASLLIGDTKVRPWSPPDQALLLQVAEGLWAAVERAKAEEALRTSNAYLNAVLNVLPVGLAIADASGRVIRFNEALNRIWGVPPIPQRTADYADWKGRFVDSGQPLTANDWAMARTLTTGKPVAGDVVEIERFDGGRATIINAAAPIKDERGQIVGGVVAELDITSQRAAEAALRISEEKYRTLFESIDEGVCVLEILYDEGGEPRDCRYVQVNPAFLKQTGQNDPTSQLGSDYVPDSAPMWLATYDAIVRSGDPVRFEQFHPDSGRWYSVYASVIGERGSRLVASVFADITERKHQEQRQEFLLSLSDALRVGESAEETGALAMRMVAQQLRLDRCWVCRFSKEQGLAWLGPEYGLPDLPPMSGEYLLGDFPETMRQVETGSPAIDDVRNDPGLSELDRRSILGLGMGAYMTTILRRGEQGYFWAICASTSGPRSWTQGDRQLLNDVTERVWAAIERARAEEALRASQKRFESIANLVPDLLWDSQPDGSTNWYNDRWLEYTGQSFDQAIGWGWVDAIHPDDREASAKRYIEAVAAGQPVRLEERIRRYDGVYRWFVVNASPLKDEQGRVVKMYGAATDIHESKHLEATLREADRRKDEFLAMLAHELRNPLAPVRNGLQLLAQTHAQDQLLSSLLPIMNRQMEHIIHMMDDLLDVSRISRDKIELHKQRIDLTQVVAQSVQAMHPLYTASGKQLSAQLPERSLYVDGDATRLNQVVTNLLTNGLRYTHESGQVWLRLEGVGEQAVLRVRDDGIGLAADQLEAIFELFVQVDTKLARSNGGLGLGLALVQQLVQLHGGQVEAQSPGLEQGSEFIVYLPILLA